MFVCQALHFDTLVGTADYHTLVPVASVPKVKQPHTNLVSLPEKKRSFLVWTFSLQKLDFCAFNSLQNINMRTKFFLISEMKFWQEMLWHLSQIMAGMVFLNWFFKGVFWPPYYPMGKVSWQRESQGSNASGCCDEGLPYKRCSPSPQEKRQKCKSYKSRPYI